MTCRRASRAAGTRALRALCAACCVAAAGAGTDGHKETGAWTLSKALTSQTSSKTCDDGTGETVSGVECNYKLDTRLASCLADFFAGYSVTELGAGLGRYKRRIEKGGRTRGYAAYDGIPNVASLTDGRVSHVDLSADDASIRQSDYALTLEVAEHIPQKYEGALMRNIDRSNTKGVLLSWSNLGRGQSAHGHVNPKRKSQVRSLLCEYGYIEDRNVSAHMRRCSTFLYLKRGVQFFRRYPVQSVASECATVAIPPPRAQRNRE